MNTTTTTATDNKRQQVLLEDPSTSLLDYTNHSLPAIENTILDESSINKDSLPLLSAKTTKKSGRGKDLLSEKQKKANHIASEQKRRANIRMGFDQLMDIVPDLNECQRSESYILQKSGDYIRQLVETKNDLGNRVRELQMALGEVPDQDSSEGEMEYGW